MLCTLGEKTCGACCWGGSIPRGRLADRLRRHRDLFRASGARRSPLALLAHEIRARRGLDLVLAPLLHVPYLGRKIRAWYSARVVCAFASFRDESDSSVGCLLHPSRYRGSDFRRSAFRLLSGFGCGAPDYFCAGALRFARSAPAEQRRFECVSRDMDWFEYGRVAPRYEPTGQKET